MCEYELYVPLYCNDGKPIDPALLDHLKHQLVEKFGGLTHFPQQNEGLWRVGGHTFRDKIVILRIIADDCDQPNQFFATLKPQLKTAWKQDEFMIIRREVQMI